MKGTTKWAAGLMFGFAIGIAPAGAAERYGTWGYPNATEGATDAVQGTVDELDRLVGEAEKARTPDPVFCAIFARWRAATTGPGATGCWATISPPGISPLTRRGP